MTNLVGMHDREASNYSPKDTWILDTIALSENPQPSMYSPQYSWITRVNWGYGSTGTIPFDQAGEALFLERFVRYVKGSKNCTRWIIGNEPNLQREGMFLPGAYAKFLGRCRNALRLDLGSSSKHEVLIAAAGPWNNSLKYTGNLNGDWIKYFLDVIEISQGNFDGFAIHAYTHGYDPKLIVSNDTMDSPFIDRQYDFQTYKDFINTIPETYADLPIYLTEANGNGPWQAVGLMPAMAAEINRYNQTTTKKKIKSLIFFRWPDFNDGYVISTKPDVVSEFRQTVALGYQSPEISAKGTIPVPSNPNPNAPQAVVRATLLNVRNAPNTSSTVVGTKTQNEKISILEEKNVDGDVWYRIGPDQWVFAGWTDRDNQAPKSDWERAHAFTAGWEGGFQDLDWDSGNWTGCEVGKGEKKGTNFGVTACSYPNRDIKNLSRAEADKIYFEDYWLEIGADKLPWPMNILAFDTAINFGTTNASYWLAQSKGNPYMFIALRLKGYRHSKSWPQAGDAWIDRTIDLLMEAAL